MHYIRTPDTNVWKIDENCMREKYETILDLGDLAELKATEAQRAMWTDDD